MTKTSDPYYIPDSSGNTKDSTLLQPKYTQISEHRLFPVEGTKEAKYTKYLLKQEKVKHYYFF
jgi:hypothetical protein